MSLNPRLSPTLVWRKLAPILVVLAFAFACKPLSIFSPARGKKAARAKKGHTASRPVVPKDLFFDLFSLLGLVDRTFVA